MSNNEDAVSSNFSSSVLTNKDLCFTLNSLFFYSDHYVNSCFFFFFTIVFGNLEKINK